MTTYSSTIEVLSYNSNGGRKHYVACVYDENKELLYFATRSGHNRWNKKLVDALVGGGYFLSEESARSTVNVFCKQYKDFDPSQVEIKPLDVKEAIDCLGKEMQKWYQQNT